MDINLLELQAPPAVLILPWQQWILNRCWWLSCVVTSPRWTETLRRSWRRSTVLAGWDRGCHSSERDAGGPWWHHEGRPWFKLCLLASASWKVQPASDATDAKDDRVPGKSESCSSRPSLKCQQPVCSGRKSVKSRHEGKTLPDQPNHTLMWVMEAS